MSTITTKDDTQIYYKDWGQGPVVTFSHRWPLNSDAWDGQMKMLTRMFAGPGQSGNRPGLPVVG